MADYKDMYLTMLRASEDAISLLVSAQRKCEELYLSAPDPEITVLKPEEQKDRPTP